MAAKLERVKKHAIKQMQWMNINPKLIDEFRDNGFIYMSRVLLFIDIDHVIMEPILLKSDSEEYKYLKKLEKDFKFVVFHVIQSHTSIGELYSYLYASQYQEEWKHEMMLISENIHYAYVENRTYPECSEIGTIGFKTCADGTLFRTQ